jgi:hypothetical protein
MIIYVKVSTVIFVLVLINSIVDENFFLGWKWEYCEKMVAKAAQLR